MTVKRAAQRNFFASANTYSGFKSYFREIFNSRDYDKIFVLKGGPGTGKSTLLRKLSNIGRSMDLNVEQFVCSSDVNSLDGVIVEGKNKRVAILDGTAPHERDAVIPGAVDTLVNLGDAINTSAVFERKNEIMNLNDQKADMYKKAYDNLQKSSVFYSNIKAEITSLIDYETMIKGCEFVFEALKPSGKSQTGIRLLSSFSKCGRLLLSETPDSFSRRFYVCGVYGSELLFLTQLSDFLSKKEIPFVKIISALDPTTVEGMYFTDDDVLIIRSEKDYDFDTKSMLSLNEKSAFYDGIKALENGMNLYEKEARGALEEASKYHFELEKIYGSAMDFNITNAKCDLLLESVSKIFS